MRGSSEPLGGGNKVEPIKGLSHIKTIVVPQPTSVSLIKSSAIPEVGWEKYLIFPVILGSQLKTGFVSAFTVPTIIPKSDGHSTACQLLRGPQIAVATTDLSFG